jgi:regulator of protease activity HflC (stomatin/prohibitin superfamily)
MDRDIKAFIIGGIVLLIGIVSLYMWGMPNYRIYKQNLQGEANLRQQEWEKKILIEEANAKNESATLEAEARIKQETAKAQAEVIRAKGVAEANTIIADSLKGNESYLRYLWIDKLSDNSNTIYVPTEAGLPILEAGKR